jgi:hypothetical protein
VSGDAWEKGFVESTRSPHAVIETVTFRLTAADAQAFLSANASVNAWLAEQPGFAGRQLARRDDGSYVDIVQWADKAAALEAAGKMQAAAGSFDAMQMIDVATISVSHCDVLVDVAV